MADAQPLLVVDQLRKVFGGHRGLVPGRRSPGAVAVDDVSFQIAPGETLGLVGESGSGKSTVARLLLRLLDATSGSIVFEGRDITNTTGREMRALRRDLQIVFQDISGSLSPRLDVGEIVAEPLRYHADLSAPERLDRARAMLDRVGLDDDVMGRYPRQLSGGQRQRVNLARALIVEPKLLVLDEPVSALDVATQSRAVNLLEDVQRDLGLAYLFIAHDLLLVHHMCVRIAVMYLGALMEHGPADDVYARPLHPYTQALLSAIPPRIAASGPQRERVILRGEAPGPERIPSGCRFRTRCVYAFDRCEEAQPELREVRPGGWVACHLHDAGPRLGGETVDVLLGRPRGQDARTTPDPISSSTSPEA